MAERGFWGRFMDRHAPTKDEVLESRWLRPFGAARARSPTCGASPAGRCRAAVFAGLFVGIFLMIPGLQIVGAALMCDPDARQYPDRRGDDLPQQSRDHAVLPARQPRSRQPAWLPGRHCKLRGAAPAPCALGEWFAWLWTDAAPAMVSGLFVIGLGVALAGYIVSLVGWRWWIGRKWRQRVRHSG